MGGFFEAGAIRGGEAEPALTSRALLVERFARWERGTLLTSLTLLTDWALPRRGGRAQDMPVATSVSLPRAMNWARPENSRAEATAGEGLRKRTRPPWAVAVLMDWRSMRMPSETIMSTAERSRRRRGR
jgi:hypothetical protein